MNQEVANWVECRRRCIGDDSGAAVFLDIDLHSLPEFVESGSPRHRALKLVEAHLLKRIRHRARGVTIFPPEAGLIEHFLEIERFMHRAFEDHLHGDREKETKACEDFAAGRFAYQRACGDLGKGYVPGDADSAYILLFAEFALAMAELDIEASRRWAPRVHMFARMQPIFLQRWKSAGRDPECFRLYDGTAPPLTEYPPELVEALQVYDDHKHDLDKLRALMTSQVAHTAHGEHPFGVPQYRVS